jgi:hypothetical protein
LGGVMDDQGGCYVFPLSHSQQPLRVSKYS